MISRPRSLVFLVNLDQPGQIRLDRSGPTGPEDDQHRLAAVLGRVDRLGLQSRTLDRERLACQVEPAQRAGGFLGRVRAGIGLDHLGILIAGVLFFGVVLVGAGELEEDLGRLIRLRELLQKILEVRHPFLLVGQDVGTGLVVLEGEVGADDAIRGVGADLASLVDEGRQYLPALRIGAAPQGCDQAVNDLLGVAQLVLGGLRFFDQGVQEWDPADVVLGDIAPVAGLEQLRSCRRSRPVP